MNFNIAEKMDKADENKEVKSSADKEPKDEEAEGHSQENKDDKI